MLTSEAAHDSKEPVVLGPCDGLIKFALFGTRALFTNLYKMNKKEILKYLNS
jgi:hypothetical protein